MDKNTKIILEAAHNESMKIAAIKTIRLAADYGLAEAKEVLGDCLMGKKPAIKLPSNTDAIRTAKKLSNLGIIVRVGNRIFDKYKGQRLAPTFLDYQVGLVHILDVLKIQNNKHKIRCTILNGQAKIGDSLSIPFNPSFVLSFKIVGLKQSEEYMELFFNEESENYELLGDFEIIGNELPILREKDKIKDDG